MMGNPGLDQIQSLLVCAPIHLANQLEIISGFNPYPNIPNIFKNLSHLWQIFGRHVSDAVERYNYIHMHMLCTYVYSYNIYIYIHTKPKKNKNTSHYQPVMCTPTRPPYPSSVDARGTSLLAKITEMFPTT